MPSRRLLNLVPLVLFLGTHLAYPVAQGGKPGQSSQKKDPGPSPEQLRGQFLECLKQPIPKKRDADLRKLVKTYRVSLETWEAALKAIPMPPFPLELGKGKRISRTLSLYAGEEGLIDTEVQIYVPRAAPSDKGFALLLAAHGTGGQGHHEMATWQRFAESTPMVILAASEQRDNQGYRFSEQERLTQLSLLRWARLHLPIDADRVFVAGTSRGGHISWDLGLRYPDIWAGIVPCIGGPRLALQQGQNNLRLLPNLLGIPVHDFQGLKDDAGLIWNLRLAIAELRKLGHKDFHFHEFPALGHSFDLSNAGLEAFFVEARRPSRPQSLHLASARLGEARRSWLQILKFKREVKDELRLKVKANDWSRLDEEGKKRFAHDYVKDRTALLEAEITSHDPLTVRIRGKRVQKARLLLPRWMWPDDDKRKLKVLYEGRTRSPKPKTDKWLYLSDYATHLDPSLAPVRYVDL